MLDYIVPAGINIFVRKTICTKDLQKLVLGPPAFVYTFPMDDPTPWFAEYTEQHDLRGDGRIILYKRPGLKNPKWQVRMRVPGAKKYKFVSTKSANLGVAQHIANELYDDLREHIKRGGTIDAKTFTQVFSEWENWVNLTSSPQKKGVPSGSVDRVRAYALQYFGAMKIDHIKPVDFQKYWLWRKENYSKVTPTNNTLGRERTDILALFKFAENHGYITSIPVATPPKGRQERRPSFSELEWTAIVNKIDLWENEGAQKATARDRFLAKRYLLFLAYTGVRVGEARVITWGDFRPAKKDGKNLIVIAVHGKTGHRDVIAPREIKPIFQQLYDLQCRDLEKLYPLEPSKWEPRRERLLFCHPDGSPIRTFKRSFYSLLNFANVPKERHGKPRTIYSLRHLFATDRLAAGISPYTVAKNMGTSVPMLERFYGHIITTDAAYEITQKRTASSKIDVSDLFKD
jgi:integrase